MCVHDDDDDDIRCIPMCVHDDDDDDMCVHDDDDDDIGCICVFTIFMSLTFRVPHSKFTFSIKPIARNDTHVATVLL
jgi:hypothetical protein